jgi:hypothetical protein
MMINLHAGPSALPDTHHPAPLNPRPFSQRTVKLIPIGEAEPLLADQVAERLSPERGLRQAHERLVAARVALGGAKAALASAESYAATARDHEVRTRVAHERARSDVRRAEVNLREQQRVTDDARLVMRQAYDLVAHVESLNDSAIVDLTLDHPTGDLHPTE